MGVEYRHGFAVADLNWLPKTEKEFEKIEKRVSEVLAKWDIVQDCVEKRTGTKRLCNLDENGDVGKWKEKNQLLRKGVPPLFEQERRIDWKPAEDSKSVQQIGGRDFEYNGVEKTPEIQWVHLQLGPNFKIFDDPYGMFEIDETEEFQCADCGETAEEIDDPWMPAMIEHGNICPSVCDCGGTIKPATNRVKPSRDNQAPDISVWKAALFIDFGKCHPKTVVWSGRMQSRDFVHDLENAFGTSLVEFGSWH